MSLITEAVQILFASLFNSGYIIRMCGVYVATHGMPLRLPDLSAFFLFGKSIKIIRQTPTLSIL
jgi:hypothetical protein